MVHTFCFVRRPRERRVPALGGDEDVCPRKGVWRDHADTEWHLEWALGVWQEVDGHTWEGDHLLPLERLILGGIGVFILVKLGFILTISELMLPLIGCCS